MTENPQIEISYDDSTPTLSHEEEKTVQSALNTLMNQTGNEGKRLSLFFCSEETIRNLNQTYRQKDEATDILSFSYEEDGQEEDPEGDIWGELALCLDICSKQAADTGLPFMTELFRLLVHGLGHLMGFDHELSDEAEREMLEMEKQLLSSIHLDDLYD